MNRIAVRTSGAALLTGCALTLFAGLAAGAVSPGEETASPREAAQTQERHHLYRGKMLLWSGDWEWTYLGAYDSAKEADAAGKAACPEDEERSFQKYRVVKAAGLALPQEAGKGVTIIRLTADDRDGRLVGHYDTAREAVAAAEKVLAAGDRFQAVFRAH
jgi:hypothetical protein